MFHMLVQQQHLVDDDSLTIGAVIREKTVSKGNNCGRARSQPGRTVEESVCTDAGFRGAEAAGA